jgi:hypothetical protein
VTAVVVLIAAIVVALFAYLGYLNWQQEQRRQQLLFGWATTNNYSYAQEDDSLCVEWAGPPFGLGDHQRATNAIRGQAKEPFVAFDYSYQTHSNTSRSGQTTETHRFHVVAVQLPGVLPMVQVTPENLLTKVGNAFGLTDIELESEDFNRRFRVHSDNPKFASDVLSPRTMTALLALPPAMWRIAGNSILTWSPGRLQPSTVTSALSMLQTIVDGIPSFVWEDHT